MFDGSLEYLFMALPGDLVEKHSGDFHLGIKLDATENLSCRRTRDLGCIHDEDDRGPEKLGQLGSGKAAPDVNAVVETPVAFNQADVTGIRTLHKGAEHLFGRHEKRVQIVAGLIGQPLPASLNRYNPALS